MSANRAVRSVHGVIVPRRIEDPPDTLFVAVASPSKNGGIPREMTDKDSGMSMEVEQFVRLKSLPLKIQEEIQQALKKRRERREDRMQLCAETVSEISQAVTQYGGKGL